MINLDMNYWIRLIADFNMSPDSIKDDADSDALYDVHFHMDNYDDCTNIDHNLFLLSFPANTEVVTKEIQEELQDWLTQQSALGKLTVTPNMQLDISFGQKRKKVVFEILKQTLKPKENTWK